MMKTCASTLGLFLALSLSATAEVSGGENLAGITSAVFQPDSPTMGKMPSFQGGTLNEFRMWVQREIVHPKELPKRAQGRVVAAFTIDQQGMLTAIQIISSPDSLFSAEVERVLRTSPKWTPAEQGGKNVNVRMTIPVDFKKRK